MKKPLSSYPFKALGVDEAFDVPADAFDLTYVRVFACQQGRKLGYKISVRDFSKTEGVYEVSRPAPRAPADVAIKPPRPRPVPNSGEQARAWRQERDAAIKAGIEEARRRLDSEDEFPPLTLDDLRRLPT